MLNCASCTERDYCFDVIGPQDVFLVTDTGSFVGISDSWSYNPIGRITVVEPSVGQVGTLVTITGLSLRGSGSNVSTVTLGGVTATLIAESDTSVVVAASQGVGVDGAVELTSTSGATVTIQGGMELP